MQRTTLIASVTLSSLLVAGIAWAGSAVLDDSSARDAAVLDLSSSDDASDDDSPSGDDSPSDDRSPSDDSSPSDDDSPSDDAPLTAPVTATHRALEAGAITVMAEGLQVRLVELTVADGWREEVEVEEGLEVEVTFRQDGARIDIKAEVDDGQLRFRVRDRRTDERTETFVSEDGTTTTGDHDDADEDSGSDDDVDDSDDEDNRGSADDDDDSDDDSDDRDDDSDDDDDDDADDDDDSDDDDDDDSDDD